MSGGYGCPADQGSIPDTSTLTLAPGEEAILEELVHGAVAHAQRRDLDVSGGLRALQIQCSNPADNTTCEPVEVGGYLDPAGNNFWGVEVIRNPADDPDVRGDEVLILASDRDHGLFILRDP